MSRTTRTFKGQEFPDKSRRKTADKKNMGDTSGLHSKFEEVKAEIKRKYEENPNDAFAKANWEAIKDRTYPVKNVDYVKYGREKGKAFRSNSNYKQMKNKPHDND